MSLGKGQGSSCSTARQAEAAGRRGCCDVLRAALLVGAWKCRVKFRDCSGRRGRNRAIPLALVTFCLFLPAADLICNLGRLQRGIPYLRLRGYMLKYLCSGFEGAGLNSLKIHRTLDYITSSGTVSSFAVPDYVSLPLRVDEIQRNHSHIFIKKVRPLCLIFYLVVCNVSDPGETV